VTHAKLSILGGQQVAEETPTLREQLNVIVDERRQRTLESVKKTIVYHVELGATAIHFDEIPNVHGADAAFVAKWLEEQGFTLTKPRLGGRTKVVLQDD
jgi:hypothetical protein